MIPLKFTLTGALGIKAGMNRDSITMDLTTIPDDAVTVAIKGDNGNGKSTIMNLGLTPFRIPPQIDDIYSHFGDEGVRELEFTHGGEHYISSITIKQSAKTKSMTAVLHVFDGEGFQPVRTLDGTVSDGKAKTYDTCLEHVLGPQSIYYMSAFKAQNSKPLSEHADPKSLMRDLLALDEPDQLSEKARNVCRYLKQRLDAKKSDVENIDSLEHSLEIINTDLNAHGVNLPDYKTKKQFYIDAVSDAKTAYETARTENADNVEIQKKRSDLIKRQAQNKDDKNGEITRINSRVFVLESNVKQQRNLLTQEPAVVLAEKQIPELETELTTLNQSLVELRDEVNKHQLLRSDLRDLQTQRAACQNNGTQQRKTCDELKERAEYVEFVPCKGLGEFAECPALQNAITARTDSAGALESLEKIRATYADFSLQIEKLTDTIHQTGDPVVRVLALEKQINEVNIKLTRARETTSKRHAIDHAQKIIDDSTAELETLKTAKEAAEDRFKARDESLQRELDILPPVNPEDQLTHASNVLTLAESNLSSATSALERCLADIAKLEAEHASIERQLEFAPAIKTEVEFISNELAAWKLLALALKGVIDLSIEDAGPAISEIANRLLLEAYGPRFTLKIVTQKTQANGIMKETFDISVIDAESNLEASIVKKSGGEMVWLDKALTDGVALYHKDAAGIDYECLFADEAEDGLTVERKEQFYRMDRAALNMGGYKRKFFISHNPAAWQMADHVIDLGGFRL